MPVGTDGDRRKRALDDADAVVAAMLLAAAGFVHLAVAPAHFSEWWVFGALFCVAAVLQLGLAVLVVRAPSRPIVTAALVLSGGLIAVWAWSRTVGLPVGPDAGSAETAGVLDGLTVLAEALIVVLAMPWRGPSLPRALTDGGRVFGAGLSVVLILAFAGGVGHA